ncbi:MAG: hypothetical protein AB1750_14430 [Chloroflexota bacterium]
MSIQTKNIPKNSESMKEQTYSAEFMLHEYDRIHSLILDEIRQAEQRVNYFLSITSVVGGALIVFFQLSTLAADTRLIATEGILTVLFLYGFMTLNRLNSRIVQLNTFRELQDEIRHFFASHDPAIASYIKFYQKTLPSKLRWNVIRLLRGSLQELMITTNAIICGAMVLVALLANGSSPMEVIGGTVLAVVVAAILFTTYHYYMRTKLQPFV